MSYFFSWYLLLTLLGWLTFPLTFRLFPALADRGFAFSRTVGLLLWGYIFWMFTSLGLSQNDLGGLLLGLVLLAGISVWLFNKQQAEIRTWLQANLSLIRNVEILFLLAFAFLALVRASNPELSSAEKPMELMFINAILRSPTFPPRDAWLSGYAISYYYFGYVMTAMLAKLTGVPGSTAHNLMTALIFGLSAVGSFGILFNLLAIRRVLKGEREIASNATLSLLGPLFLLIVSNAEGVLEILHRLGLFWSDSSSRFWTWLGIKDLNLPPPQAPGLVPDRYLWWWRASRVVSDYDLSGGFKEIIDEFPFFSFLHADLHPHVLAIPFSLLAVGIALHIYLTGWRGRIDLLGYSLHVSRLGFLFTALTLGGLAFLNTWDILVAATLIVSAYVWTRVSESGWDWGRFEDIFAFGLPLGFFAFILYFPFYVGFSSQLGGILPNLVYPTRGAHLWVMFATLFLPLYVYLIYVWRHKNTPGRWVVSLSISLVLVFVLWLLSWLLGWFIIFFRPSVGSLFLQMQGVPDLSSLFTQAFQKRVASVGSLLSLLALLIPALSLLLGYVGKVKAGDSRSSSPTVFVLLLTTLGALLVIGPEFLYLRDQFGTRINTVFKFYYQAWMLWSLVVAYAITDLLRNLNGIWKMAFRIGLGMLLLVGLTYPPLALGTRTNNFQLARAIDLLKEIRVSEGAELKQKARQELASLWTLDYFDFLQRQNPDEAAAIRWLQDAPDGIMTEAVGGSYTGYGRISTYTGLPTVLGWPGHESQWRGGYHEQGSRQSDIETLYATRDWQIASEILSRYNIRYVYIGNLERIGSLREEKFQEHLILVFQQGEVAVYEVP